MDLGIRERVALVTGADSGIGLETARRLLAEGVTVFMTDMHEESLALAAGRLEGRVFHGAADLTRASEVARLMEKVERTTGRPDILICAAGITGTTGPFELLDDAVWMEVLETNLMSAVRCCRAVVPEMRLRGWGRIVLIASEDAVQPYAEELPYCASKAALLNLAKGLSKSCGPDGVLVNAVSPAFIETPMTGRMMEQRAGARGESFNQAIDSFLAEERPGMALKRRGRPEEVADAIAFLCSERASFVNGANLRVDSGSVMTMAV